MQAQSQKYIYRSKPNRNHRNTNLSVKPKRYQKKQQLIGQNESAIKETPLYQ